MSDYSPSSTCYHSNVLSYDVRFETYSDARLAAVFLDNMDQFPVDLFQQVLDVVIDRQFQSSQVTFKNIWGIFDRVSTYRRNMALDRTVPKSHKAERSSGVVPPVVLSLVVDTIVQQRAPLSREVQQHWWCAFKRNGADLCNMALVHRSWTEIAQKGLRRRAVIPHKKINRFLVNPLCGPWVTEMIIDWTPEEDDPVSSNDFDLLEALLAHTPNLHSLVFNTYLVYYNEDTDAEPRLEVGPCPNIISDKLPDLRYFWLGHLNGECIELRSLCACIPKMQSLEFLDIRNWVDLGTRVLNWNEHPPSSLKAIGLHLKNSMEEETLAWLLRPRGSFNLQSLFIRQGNVFHNRYRELVLSLRSSLHQLEHLAMTMLAIQSVDTSAVDDLFLNCNKLTSLELFYDQGFQDQTIPYLPLSLERLTIYCHSKEIRGMHTTELGFIQSLKDKISMLLRLQSLFFVIHDCFQRCSNKAWDCICNGLDSGFYHGLPRICGQADTCLPKELEDFCTDRNIHLACMDAKYMENDLTNFYQFV